MRRGDYVMYIADGKRRCGRIEIILSKPPHKGKCVVFTQYGRERFIDVDFVVRVYKDRYKRP